MLALAAPGTFLLRFSKAKASAVAIAFKESATAYKHTVIATSAGACPRLPRLTLRLHASCAGAGSAPRRGFLPITMPHSAITRLIRA